MTLSPASLAKMLGDGLSDLRLSLPQEQQDLLLLYLDMIAKWNKVYNLTAIRDAGEMLIYHLLDSLAVIQPLLQHLMSGRGALKKKIRLADIGAGAGLPGVVIAICCPAISVVCVDAVGKKVAFIQQVAATLRLNNLRGLHARVEKMAVADVGGGFDIITSRAFASLADFVRLTTKILAQDGVWMAMKATQAEVTQGVLDLGGGADVFHVEQLQVPNLDAKRCLVWMRRP